MFKDVPAQVWLLLAISAIAYAPALYVYRYINHAPSRRDITLPSEDLSWRTPGQLGRCVAVLIGLVILGIFIFTPAAAQFAHSPAFMPILMAAIGSWAIYTVPRGLTAGKIEPIVRGLSKEYERATQPKRYWASVTWNAVLGCSCLWLAYATIDQGVEDQCYDRQVSRTPEEELAACNKLIQERGVSGKDYAGLVAARGFAYHRLGDLNNAIVDYDEALQLNPQDSYALYNRALILDSRGSDFNALSDYNASLKVRPDNFDGFINRGMLFLRNGRPVEAGNDFSKAHELKPSDTSVLAYRGLSYALQKDRSRAAQDFRAVKASDPKNPELQKGLAILNMSADDL